MYNSSVLSIKKGNISQELELKMEDYHLAVAGLFFSTH